MSFTIPFALRGQFQHSTVADKDADMSSLERDAGFCSGGDDEELDDLHSPTDASEDSVEVKVEPISRRNKNKRKCAEPRKVANEDVVLQPYKKRRHFVQQQQDTADLVRPEDRCHDKQPSKIPHPVLVKEDLSSASDPRSSSVSPFRPWSHARPPPSDRCTPSSKLSPDISSPPQYTERVPQLPNQDEPLSLVLKDNKPSSKPRERRRSVDNARRLEESVSFEPRTVIKCEYPSAVTDKSRRLEIPDYDQPRFGETSLDAPRSFDLSRLTGEDRMLQYSTGVIIKREPDQVQSHPFTITRPPEEDTYRIDRRDEAVDFTMNPGPSRAHQDRPYARRTLAELANEDRVVSSGDIRACQSRFNVDSLLREGDDGPGTSSTPSTSSDKKNSPGGNQQRNYKNMTRERRVEANARERTRVHTISAAFDTLRRTIPAYSHNQKLSKLSVLRIACSYILTLSRVAGNDYSADNSEPSLADCVDYVSRTIQTEGKLRKKKDE